MKCAHYFCNCFLEYKGHVRLGYRFYLSFSSFVIPNFLLLPQLLFASLQLVTLTADRTALNVTPRFTIWTQDLFPLFAIHLLFIPAMLGQFVPRHRGLIVGLTLFPLCINEGHRAKERRSNVTELFKEAFPSAKSGCRLEVHQV